MKSTKPIYTIGHRNPDTDSICSAIGYAHLKQALGENVVAARAGKINAETKYALEHFQVEQPLLLTDLYPRVKDITIDCKIVVKQHDTLRHLGEVMREHDLKSVPVTGSICRQKYWYPVKRASSSRAMCALPLAASTLSRALSSRMT